MAQTLDARFQIKDDGSVVLRNISKELYKVKSNTKDASKAADAFGDTSVGATKRARKGHEELNDTLAGTERAYKSWESIREMPEDGRAIRPGCAP